jgi:hypothetical protein
MHCVPYPVGAFAPPCTPAAAFMSMAASEDPWQPSSPQGSYAFDSDTAQSDMYSSAADSACSEQESCFLLDKDSGNQLPPAQALYVMLPLDVVGVGVG